MESQPTSPGTLSSSLTGKPQSSDAPSLSMVLLLMAVKESDAERSNPDAPHALTASAAHPAKTVTMTARMAKVAKEARAKVARAKVAREATSALRSGSSQRQRQPKNAGSGSWINSRPRQLRTAPKFGDGLKSSSQLKARPTPASHKSQLSLPT